MRSARSVVFCLYSVATIQAEREYFVHTFVLLLERREWCEHSILERESR
jgi:hypothetical protein